MMMPSILHGIMADIMAQVDGNITMLRRLTIARVHA